MNTKVKTSDISITIVIKALNEEENIEKCIKSSIIALKGFNGKIILVDSKSDDKTIDIAKKYPIKIIQLKYKKDRSCGIGPQIGYLNTNTDYIYILDGDMVINKNFIKKAIPYFSESNIAGIAGNIIEKSKNNLAFQVRKKHHIVDEVKIVDRLGMGGLYKKSAIDDVGFFSNPSLNAYEESDLASKLSLKNYILKRIPVDMLEHFGEDTMYISTLFSRFKSKYIFGSGQFLRLSIIDNHFFKTALELKIYIVTLIWYLFGIISLLLQFKGIFIFLKIFIIASIVLISLILLIKRNVKRTIFSLISWSLQSLGLLIGFITYKNKKVTNKLYTEIK